MNSIWIIGGGLFTFALYAGGADWRWIGALSLALLGWTFDSMVSARADGRSPSPATGGSWVRVPRRPVLLPGIVTASVLAQTLMMVPAHPGRLEWVGPLLALGVLVVAPAA